MIHENELLRYLQQLTLPSIDYPHLSNRGVIDPHSPIVFSHLDYLQMTLQQPRAFGKDNFTIPFLSDLLDIQREHSGVKYYRYGAQLFPAGTLYWNEKNAELPALLVMGGHDLALLRERTKLSDNKLLARFKKAAIAVTRIDFATTINRGHPSEVVERLEAKRYTSRIRKVERIDDPVDSNGYTVYLGSRKSDKFIRCYDKAAELKLLDSVLTRIELQTRGRVADNMTRAMLKHGVKPAGKQAIRDMIQFEELTWWDDAVAGDTVDMQLTPAKETSFERWLLEQVLPAIEKRVKAGEEQAAIDTFTRYLLALYGDLGGSSSKDSKQSDISV